MSNNDGLILELFQRIQKLEKEVSEIRREIDGRRSIEDTEDIFNPDNRFFSADVHEPERKRDTTRYLYKGNVYFKNRLVLAIVSDYAGNKDGITCYELKNVFPKSLQGSIGVVEYADIAVKRHDYKVRFFADKNEVIHLSDGDMFVCSQWGILNIGNFIARAKELGFDIKEIK